MTYAEFRKLLIDFKVFSIAEVRKVFPAFDTKRLVEWQQKGHIKKLINKWYLFSEIPLTEHLLYRISNCLHQPSYISLDSALSFYQLIPEQVYTQLAVSTRKTVQYKTPVGLFNYRSIKPVLYFGYQVIHKDGLPAVVADLEKAILDYLYLNASIKTKEDLQGLRWNMEDLKARVDWEKLNTYAAVFGSNTLDKKLRLLEKMMLNAHVA